MNGQSKNPNNWKQQRATFHLHLELHTLNFPPVSKHREKLFDASGWIISGRSFH